VGGPYVAAADGESLSRRSPLVSILLLCLHLVSCDFCVDHEVASIFTRDDGQTYEKKGGLGTFFFMKMGLWKSTIDRVARLTIM
jgi:hypothetical protein